MDVPAEELDKLGSRSATFARSSRNLSNSGMREEQRISKEGGLWKSQGAARNSWRKGLAGKSYLRW